MCLCCEDNMSKPLLLLEAAWAGRVLRPQEFDFLPLDCTVDTVTLHPVSRPPPPKIPSAQGIANLLLSQNLRTLLGLEDA